MEAPPAGAAVGCRAHVASPGVSWVIRVSRSFIVVFSSLSPHLTGPNTTDAVRKAYILQYAPDGAQVFRGDPAQGPPPDPAPANDPRRQFPVLTDGRPVAPASLE